MTGGVTTAISHYSFGGLRVAVKRGGALYHLHGDHLGSTSLTTAGSVVEGSRAYYAYGSERSVSGDLKTDRTFTGQKSDATGLLYYNARYYDPTLGTFISPDSLVPGAGQVINYNRFLYVRGNPLKYTDPSGHIAVEPQGPGPSATPDEIDWYWKNRWYEAHGWGWDGSHWSRRTKPRFEDMSILQDVLVEEGKVVDWLIVELMRSSRSEEAVQIQFFNVRGWELKPIAYSLWIKQVRPRGPWDHKAQIVENFGFWQPAGGNYIYLYDIWSNIHYGYIGRLVGFSQKELTGGAGLAQIVTDRRVSREWTSSNFDDPSDQAAILIGITLYDTHELIAQVHDYGITINYDLFWQEFNEYAGRLTRDIWLDPTPSHRRVK